MLVSRYDRFIELYFEAEGDETDDKLEEKIAKAVLEHLEPTYEMIMCEQIQSDQRAGKNMVVYFGAERDLTDYQIPFDEFAYVEKFRRLGDDFDFFFTEDQSCTFSDKYTLK